MEEVPEEAIEQAEGERLPPSHEHAGISAEDGTLLGHLQHEHGLDAPPTLSPATQEGLHDRVHGERKAADA